MKKVLCIISVYYCCINNMAAQSWLLNGNSNASTASFAGTSTNLSMRFRTNNTERMVIDSLGRIGIGTSSPQAAFEVKSGNGLPLWVTSNSSSGIGIDRGNNAFGHLITFTTNHGLDWALGNYTLDNFNFFNYNNAPVMTLTPSGKIGIGTETPSEQFTVLTNADAYGFLHTNNNVSIGTFISSVYGGEFGTKSNHPLSFFTNNSGPLATLSTSGNFGIGTTTPTCPLSFANNSGDKISFYDGYNGKNFGIGIAANVLQIHADTLTGDVAFGYGKSSSMTETVRIKGTGNVGIGTSNPLRPLSFANAFGDKISFFDGTGQTSYGIGIGSGTMQLHTDAVGADIVLGYGSNSSFTETMRIKGSGKVGIGISNPLYKLTIKTTNGNWGFMHTTGNVNFGTYIGALAGNDIVGQFGTKTNHAMSLFTNNTSRIFITSYGYVGINTNSPSSLFEVNGTSNFLNISHFKAPGGGTSAITITGPNGGQNVNLIYANASGTIGPSYAGNFNGDVIVMGNFSNPSDEKLKENIKPLNEVLSKIMSLKVSTYNFKKIDQMCFPAGKQNGFIAQDIEKVFPELVLDAFNKPNDSADIFKFKSINYIGMIPILTEAIQEQQRQIESTDGSTNELKNKVTSLEGQNTELKNQLEVLKAKMHTFEQSLSECCTNYKENNGSKQLPDYPITDSPKLEQNTPNPFTQNTSINFYIPSASSSASLNIFSETGVELKSFNIIAKGKGSIEINANTLSAGIYNYQLIVDGKTVDTKQMILTK